MSGFDRLIDLSACHKIKPYLYLCSVLFHGIFAISVWLATFRCYSACNIIETNVMNTHYIFGFFICRIDFKAISGYYYPYL